MPMSRRELLVGSASVFAFRHDTLRQLIDLPFDEACEDDEIFWKQIRSKFDIDPKLTVFNHAGLSPSPQSVNDVIAVQLRRANADPSYIIWRKQDNELEPIRSRLAELVGCETEELALTANATYGLQTAILGVPMVAGDEILVTNHEYSRTHTAIDQRVRRDGVTAITIELKSPPEAGHIVAKQILEKVTPKTKLVILSQMTFLVGSFMPIQEVAKELENKGIPLLVDGAHGIGLLPEKFSELGAPIYTACLHKWLMGPIGTGVLVVKKPWINRIWPLHPAEESLNYSIKKFEQVGTRSAAPFLALQESLSFHQMIGRDRKASRLEYLRQRLAEKVLNAPGVTHYGSLDTNVCRVFLTIGFKSASATEVANWLLTKHGIHVTTVLRAGIIAIRISPNIFTTLEEIDRLAALLEKVARYGIGT
jgi:selenocysteine lyase/cysteine desulfurase